MRDRASIGWLIAARLVQGVGGSVLMVVPRAVIRYTGLASSLGALQMVLGRSVVIASAPFFDGTTLPMVGAIAACGAVVAVLAWGVLSRPAQAEIVR